MYVPINAWRMIINSYINELMIDMRYSIVHKAIYLLIYTIYALMLKHIGFVLFLPFYSVTNMTELYTICLIIYLLYFQVYAIHNN